MNGDYSAYAALGLKPGAGRAEIDEAYRRLIKRYHPDRIGGDCSRAAEINRAYTQLRRQFGQPVRPRRSMPVPVQPRRRPSRQRMAGLLSIAVVAAGVVAVANDRPRLPSDRTAYADSPGWPASSHRPDGSAAVAELADFEEPLRTAVIDRAIADAVKFHGVGNPAASIEYSRACHNSFREQPSLAWFDSCTAFDEATVILTGADLFADSGQFSTSSVVARHFGAARHLSGDTWAADSRLSRIRSRVELSLIPVLEQASARQP